MKSINLTAVPHIPHVQPGQDLTNLILNALTQSNLTLRDGDILAIAQKIVSKAEGRQINLVDVSPSEEALKLGLEIEKDPRLIELILQESEEISRTRKGVIIVRHRLGFTSANAGIDRSNVAQSELEPVLLLPVDPDDSAAKIRQQLRNRQAVEVGIIITDSHGRPFRRGTVNIAIGVAGLPAIWDRRGDVDLYGYTLKVTEIGVADELAAAAGLIMGQADEGLPVVLIRGLTYAAANGRAVDLVRPKEFDLYR